MFRKQIQKFIKNKLNFSNKNRFAKYGQRFLLSFFVLTLLAPMVVLVPNQAVAQPRGPVNQTCEVTSLTATGGVVKVDKYKLNEDEVFSIFADVKISSQVGAACNTQGKDDIRFSYYLYNGDGPFGCSTSQNYNYRVTTNASFYSENGTYGFRHKLTSATLKKFFEGTISSNYGEYSCLYVYVHKRTEAPSSGTYYLTYEGGPQDTEGYIRYETGTHGVTDPSVPGNITGQFTVWENALLNNNKEGARADQLGVNIKPDSENKGLRSRYRVSLEKPETMEFGVTKGLDAIYADWLSSSPKLELNQYIGIPNTSKATLEYDFSPQFKYIKMYFADGSKTWDPDTQCNKDVQSGVDEKCDNIVYVDNAYGRGSLETYRGNGLLPGYFNPALKSAVWVKPEFQNKAVAEGESVGSVPVYVVPILWGDNGRKISYVIGKGKLEKVILEVYKTDKDIITACKNDPLVADKTQCDNIEYAKYGFSSSIEQSSSSSETPDQGTAANLFGFLAKVVSYVVLLLTTVIFYVFAYIIVPVLTALLNIHPWHDKFVDFIYPGWVIMRNLANIAFIAALLYMGLRILFQVEDASRSRSFIIRLILMALLVNFSLVIGQGIVAIADTVQSQFLPANSKVIEALGAKLMVDPIVTFRDGGLSDSANNFTAGAAASDIPKAMILLILAVAAFFSFVAITAFVLVRLVALWVLYMVSPLGYVAFILPQTQQYAKQWWDEFIKYAIMVPVLAFFLNIAALMANVFSVRTGDTVSTSSGYELLGVDIAGELVEYVLTVASHFIVLLFIFIGMKYALKSGTIGSKEIVNAAKTGFDAVTRKAPKALGVWAKDSGSDALADTSVAKRLGLSNAIRSIARPIEAGKAIKKGYFDEPKKQMNERFANSFDRMRRNVQPWGENKLFPMKWAVGKLGSDQLNQRYARKLKAQTAIMNDEVKQQKITERDEKNDRLNMLENNEMTVADGQVHLERLNDHIDSLQDQLANPNITQDEQDAIRDQLTERRDERDALETSMNAAVGDRFSFANVQTKAALDFSLNLKGEHNIDQMREDLRDQINEITEEINQDDNLRADLEFQGVMTDDRRAKINEHANELINKYKLPVSVSVESETAAEVGKKSKEIADMELDYDQLALGLESALASNNDILARAYTKEIAKTGDIKKLLTQKNLPYNMNGLTEFVYKNFKGSEHSKNIIIREISNTSVKNNSIPLGFAVKNLVGGRVELKTIDSQLKDVSKKMAKLSAKDIKDENVTFNDPRRDNDEVLTPGIIDWAKNNNTAEKAKVVERELSKPVAQKIWDFTTPQERRAMGVHISGAIEKIVTGRRGGNN